MRCENVIPIKDFGGGGSRRFHLKRCRRSEPKCLNPRCSNQIREFWPERTQAGYLVWNLSVTTGIGPFLSKFECASSARSRIRSLESINAPSNASIKQTSEKSQAEGAQLGVGRVWLAKPRQRASGTTDPWAQEVGPAPQTNVPVQGQTNQKSKNQFVPAARGPDSRETPLQPA